MGVIGSNDGKNDISSKMEEMEGFHLRDDPHFRISQLQFTYEIFIV